MHNLISRKVLSLAAFLALAVVSAAGQHDTAAMEKANQLFSAKNWAAAAEAFAGITAADPSATLAWLRLGVSRHKLGQYEQAIAAYRQAEAHPQIGPSALYREAASYARLNNKEQALALIGRAIDAGLSSPSIYRQDEDLASLRGDSTFEELMSHAETLAAPCAHSPEYRQFDFWLGEWAVETTNGGQRAGESSIQSILGRCILLENWTGAGGMSGKSFNRYDAQRKMWIQDWVDDHGGGIHFEGHLENGVMSYYADSLDKDGSPVRRHLQFFPLGPDKVRQFSQRSKDGGKTWTPEYDLTYIRKK